MGTSTEKLELGSKSIYYIWAIKNTVDYASSVRNMGALYSYRTAHSPRQRSTVEPPSSRHPSTTYREATNTNQV